jgi:RHS repeat-associated protein
MSADLNAYGEVVNLRGKAEDCPFRYPGQYEDVETGLYYNRFRYYDAKEGIYITSDPLKLKSGIMNFHAYVHDPTCCTDVFGLSCNGDDFVDLTNHRRDHILNRHRAGAGKPGKTEFPSSWSDDKILHNVSDVATDPSAFRDVGKWNSPYAIGKRDGIEIRVDFYPNDHPVHAGKVSTAYPINVPANPT